MIFRNRAAFSLMEFAPYDLVTNPGILMLSN